MQLQSVDDEAFICYPLLHLTAGNSWDLSSAVMDRALMHADGVYKFPAQRVQGHMCRTNIASNTAFRGFGGPQVCIANIG
jgi:xanthine dehydrogenase/oxidase